MLPGERRIICMVWRILPASDLYYADHAQHILTEGLYRDDLNRDLSVRRVKPLNVGSGLRGAWSRFGPPSALLLSAILET